MTSERTISQVRAILNKLDRSIDEAREKRRHGPASPAPHTPAPPAYATPPQTIAPAPAPAGATPATPPSTSGFGRAQPLRQQASNMIRFNQH